MFGNGAGPPIGPQFFPPQPGAAAPHHIIQGQMPVSFPGGDMGHQGHQMFGARAGQFGGISPDGRLAGILQQVMQHRPQMGRPGQAQGFAFGGNQIPGNQY